MRRQSLSVMPSALSVALALLAMVVAFFVGLRRSSPPTRDPALRWMSAGLVGSMAAFLAYGLNYTIVVGARGGLAFCRHPICSILRRAKSARPRFPGAAV